MWICIGIWAQGSTHQSFEQSGDPFLWPGWDQDPEPELLWGFGEAGNTCHQLALQADKDTE